MRQFEVGQCVARYRDGAMIDRGEVLEIINADGDARLARIKWVTSGILDVRRGDDIRVLHTVEAGIDFLELESAGISEADFWGGGQHRRADHPWLIADNHREQLRPWLETHGFKADEAVEAQESHDRDGFLLRQEFPLP